jgi:hypothetical protein
MTFADDAILVPHSVVAVAAVTYQCGQASTRPFIGADPDSLHGAPIDEKMLQQVERATPTSRS